jgi:hypothetical protein
MNHASAWNLSYYPGTGTFLRTRAMTPVFRYDDDHIYFWDKKQHQEIAIGRGDLLALLGRPIDNTAPPRMNR